MIPTSSLPIIKGSSSRPEFQSLFVSSRVDSYQVDDHQGARSRYLQNDMKPELTMADVKGSISDAPVVLTQMTAAPEQRKRNTKKYLIIGGSIVLVVAIVLTAILVGMYFFSEGQKNILKYTMNVDKDTKDDATVDENDNSIEYHSKTNEYELWVIDDFNKDIQTMKVKTGSGTNCYIGPLNRTSLADPATIKALPNLPKEANKNYTSKLSFAVSGTPVVDTSFLGKKARDACKGISVYWLHPKCDDPNELQRNKRYCYYYDYCYYYYCYYGYYICTYCYYVLVC